MADEPHAPAKADAGELVEVEEFPLAVDVDPVESSCRLGRRRFRTAM